MFGKLPGADPQAETALAGMPSAEPYRVIVFSFDSLETDESLRLYRAREHMPADWKMVRADESEIREFFGFSATPS